MSWILDDTSNTHTIPLYIIIPANAEVVYIKIGDVIVEQDGTTINIPLEREYNEVIPIQINLKNTGGLSSRLKFELVDSVTNELIAYNSTQLAISPNQGAGFSFSISMPNKDLSVKVKAYHEE